MTSSERGADLPQPGREAAPGATAEGMDDAEITVDEQGERVLRRRERSGTGPGAGEEDVVSVETGVQTSRDGDTTRHPSLREQSTGEG